MLLQECVAQTMQFFAWEHREHVPPQFKRSLNGPIFIFALIQEPTFKRLAEFQILLVERAQFPFADDVSQPADALDVSVASEQLAREGRMIFPCVAFAHAILHQA
jgi:hypothetical protein